MKDIKVIAAVWLLYCFGSCFTLSVKDDGDPMIYSISGDPSDWTNGTIVSVNGTVRGTIFTLIREGHLIQKLGSSFWSRKLLYSNSLRGKIQYLPMVLGDETHQTVTIGSVHVYTSKQIGGLTVDWTTQNVYWTDQVYNWIMIAQLETPNHYLTIITTGLDKPGGIRVHPGKSFLFWTDYSATNPKIERSSLLGNNRTVLVNTNLVTPVALDIDYTTDRIYWVDTGRQTIERCDYYGNTRITFKQGSFVSAQLGIRVYEDNLYTIASDKLSLMKISDSTALKTISIIKMYMTSAADIEIFGELKQPQLTSPCDNSSCSHFCVGSNDNTQHTCACLHGAKLLFGYQCTKMDYIPPPVYIYTTEKSICWYPVWTPDLEPAEVKDKCYYNFDQDFTHMYLTHSLNTRSLYCSAGENLYVIPLRTGASAQWITTTSKTIKAIALDWISDNIYYTDVDGFISVMKTNGQYQQTILEGVTGVAGLVVDPGTGYMYWTCSISIDTYIGRAAMSGENITKLVSTDVRRPEHLALDYLEKRLYWTDSFKDEIESVKTDGTERRIVITVTNSVPYGIAVFQDHIVWTDKSAGTPQLLWAYKDGSGLASNIMKTEDVVDVILYGEYSQPQDYTNACSTNSGGCEYMCLPKPSGRVCRCPVGYHMDQDSVTCTASDIIDISSSLIIIDVGQLTFLKMSIDTYEVVALPVIELRLPMAIAADLEDDLMFWTDVRSYRIYKASLSGENQEVVKVLTTGSVADGIAVDWEIDTIFYTDTTLDVIASMDYEGNNERTIISQGLDKPRAITLDVERRTMYWTDWGLNPYIKKATYEGNNKQTLVESSLGWPNGLTLDTKDQILYWCDGKLERIESVHTDGTNRRPLALSSNSHFFNIAEFENYLYVTDWNSKHLQRISKNGGTLTEVGERVLTKAYGIVALNHVNRTVSTSNPSTTPPPSTTTTPYSATTNILNTTTPTNSTTFTTTTTRTTTTIFISPPSGQEQDYTMIIVVVICVAGFIILAVVLSIGIYCCLKKCRSPTNPARLNSDYLTNKDVAPPPIYDDVYQGRPYSSVYYSIDERYIHATTSLQDVNADNDKNPYANRRSDNIYMRPISAGIPPTQTTSPIPGAPVWSTEESTADYTKLT